MKIHIEVLGGVKIANVTCISSSTGDTDSFPDVDNKITVTTNGQVLRINDTDVECEDLNFQTMRFIADTKDGCSIFRLPLDTGGGMNTQSGDSLQIIDIDRNINTLTSSGFKHTKPSLEKGENYDIFCDKCDALVGRIEVQRILPLPSADWRQVAANWFCCSTRHLTSSAAAQINPTSLNPRNGDVIYGPAYCLLNKDVFLDCNLVVDETDKIVRCVHCNLEIGEQSDQAYQVWYYAVNIIKTSSSENVNNHANISKLKIHPQISDSWDNFRELLRYLVSESGSRMPAFKFVSHKKEKILSIWILDKCLSCYCSEQFSDKSIILSKQKMLKIMFTENNGNPEVNGHLNGSFLAHKAAEEEVRLSDVMHSSAVQMLSTYCKHFPYESKFVAGKQISFIKL